MCFVKVAKHGAATFVEVWTGGAWLSTLLPSFARQRFIGAKDFVNGADAVHVVLICWHLHAQMTSSVKRMVMTSQLLWARKRMRCVSPEILPARVFVSILGCLRHTVGRLLHCTAQLRFRCEKRTKWWCWIDPIFLQQLGDETQFSRDKESDYCMTSSPRAKSSSPDAGSLLGDPVFEVNNFRHNVVCGSHLRSHCVLTVHWRSFCGFCCPQCFNG